MIVSIMQPTYFPWLGYFDLISRADIFVFLDDVQFSYRSWQHRNRIVNRGKETMLTVPVINKGDGKRIKDILINESQNWREKHLNCIKEAYRGSKYYKMYFEFLARSTDSMRNTSLSRIRFLSMERFFAEAKTASERKITSVSFKPFLNRVDPLLTISQIPSARPMLGAISTDPEIL